MKGDFSRIRFNPAKLYTAVLKQQGRVDLDSDANEQRAIDVALRETANRDIIGLYGGPVDNAGFEIQVAGKEIWILPGRYYVEGILVEIPQLVHYDCQPYLVDPLHSAQDLLESLDQAGEGSCLQFVLEVWQRMATALDDPCLLEPALNQADTTTRLQTVWRVVGTLESSRKDRIIAQKLVEVRGRMCAGTPGEGSGCGCQPIPAAGYQGMENQLYRVEIHQSGDLASATFKWSRENGSVVVKVTDVNYQAGTVTVSSLGPDANLGFQAGQWVELSDDTDRFAPVPKPGTLYRILSVNQTALQATMTTPIAGLHKNKNARMRRWDQSGSSAAASGIPVSNTPIPLESGIQVEFTSGRFQAGDYWTIPARTAIGSIEWPPCGSDGSACQLPSYIPIYYAPLACVSRSAVRAGNPGGIQDYLEEIQTIVTDQRSFFPSLSTSAIHIEEISWNNADLMTLDRFLGDGLYVALDNAPTSPVDAAVFRVTLEIGGLSSFRQSFDNSPASKMDLVEKTINLNVGGSEINVNAGLSGARATSKPSFRVGPALRQEYVLDGIVTKLAARYQAGRIVTWSLPVNTDQGYLVYQLNSLLVDAYQSANNAKNVFTGIPAARVRVRLFGHAIFAEPTGSCGPRKTIYLDGQCFGTTGRLSDGSPGIALEQPSGNSAVASDFESWFYLAPVPEVESVSLSELTPSTTLYVGAVGATEGSSSGTSTGTVTLNMRALSDTTINLTPSTQTGITLTLSSQSIVIAAGQRTSPQFTVTVQATSAAPNGPVTLTVTAAPQFQTAALSRLFSSSGSLSVTVSNPVAIATTSLPDGVVGRTYTSTTLKATGGTPPYTWSLPAGMAAPARLTLSTTGVISGTPTSAGDFTITVQVADSANPAATVEKQFTLIVYRQLVIITKSLPPATVNVPYAGVTLSATGGVSPYVWTCENLPPGLSVNSNTGEISGTPASSASNTGYGVAITVQDSESPAASNNAYLQLNVEPAGGN